MKTPLRIIAGITIFILYFAGKGAREQTETASLFIDALGMAMHLVAMLILFAAFFHWHRTMISPPDFKKHRIPLACSWFFISGVMLFGAFGLLRLGIYSGDELTRTQASLALALPLVVLMAVAALASATGLLCGAKWAKVVALLHDSTLARVRPFSQPLVHDTTA